MHRMIIFATSRRRPESASDGGIIVRSVSRFCSNYPGFTHRRRIANDFRLSHKELYRTILTVPVRASSDVFIYRRRPAPVRYVTTQMKISKNRPVPGRLSNSPMMCKSVKSYDVSFICDHSIKLKENLTNFKLFKNNNLSHGF